MRKTIHDPRYVKLISRLRRRRRELGLSQDALARKLGVGSTWVAKVETCERRLDVLETIDLLRALDIELHEAVRLVQEGRL